MVAVAGYAAQALATGRGPWANLSEHLADPLTFNIVAVLSRTAADGTPLA